MKCLVTKLKNEVDNPLLCKPGEFIITVDNRNGDVKDWYIEWGKKLQVVSTEGYMIVAGENIKELAKIDYNTPINFSKHLIKIKVITDYTSAYNIYLDNTNYTIDEDVFLYHTNRRTVHIMNNSNQFDLSKFSGGVIQNLRCGSGVYGDLSLLNYDYDVEEGRAYRTFHFSQSKRVTGELRDFLNKLKKILTSDREIEVFFNGVITLDGEVIQADGYKKFVYTKENNSFNQ